MNRKTNTLNKTGKQIIKPKHVPERTCIACRKTGNKKELIRLVRTGDSVEVDPSGKKAGRGAYLCAVAECWGKGLKGNRLEHALNIKMSSVNRQSLVEYGNSLVRRS